MSKHRFLNLVRTIKWQENPLEVYLRVSYGRQEIDYGEEAFYNDGVYSSEEQFNLALQGFLEN